MLIKNLFWINLILVGFITAQSVIKINNLQKKDGLYYQPRDSNPYTGRIIDVNENGDINLEGNSLEVKEMVSGQPGMLMAKKNMKVIIKMD